MSYKRKISVLKYNYYIGDNLLLRSEFIKYLDMHFDHKMVFSHNIITKKNETLKAFGFIKRNYGLFTNVKYCVK